VREKVTLLVERVDTREGRRLGRFTASGESKQAE